MRPSSATFRLKHHGFTLLEVLVATALLSIALLMIVRLFSAGLKGISSSEEHVTASLLADIHMREVLHQGVSVEGAYSEITDDGYGLDTSISEVLAERTAELPVRLMEVTVTLRWPRGTHKKSFTLKTMRLVQRQETVPIK